MTVGCIEVPRDGGHGLRRHACRRRPTASSTSSRSQADPPGMPDKPGHGAAPAWASMSSNGVPDRAAASRRGRPELQPRFRQGHHSRIWSRTAKRSRIASRRSCVRSTEEARALLARRRNRRRLLGSQYRPDRRRARRSISTTATGRSGPMARSRRRPNSCMTWTAGAARRSPRWSPAAASSPAQRCSRSLLFTGVRVHSYATIDEAVVLPYVDVGRNARLTQGRRSTAACTFPKASSSARIRSSTPSASAAPRAASA